MKLFKRPFVASLCCSSSPFLSFWTFVCLCNLIFPQIVDFCLKLQFCFPSSQQLLTVIVAVIPSFYKSSNVLEILWIPMRDWSKKQQLFLFFDDSSIKKSVERTVDCQLPQTDTKNQLDAKSSRYPITAKPQ